MTLYNMHAYVKTVAQYLNLSYLELNYQATSVLQKYEMKIDHINNIWGVMYVFNLLSCTSSIINLAVTLMYQVSEA